MTYIPQADWIILVRSGQARLFGE